jgi:predicted TIM-barrel fold metal-dependent hydrolase
VPPDSSIVNDLLRIQRQALTYPSAVSANPDRRDRYLTLISVDDHLVEPPHLFEGRLPAKYGDRAPKVIDRPDGSQAWLLDGAVLPQIAINAVVGRAVEEQVLEPVRFDHVRPGTWDIHERIRDMDIDGVYASLNFPSALGFAGIRLTALSDADFVLAVVRAWNDWHLEEWYGRYPERIIPCQLPYLADARIAADEVRTNATRGFHALTFPESPQRVGLPSLHGDYWDPLWTACEETRTVVCIHSGSAGLASIVDPSMPRAVTGPMFAISQCLNTAIEWMCSGVPERYPDLKICLSEGGIGWVVALLDRLDHDTKRTRKRLGERDDGATKLTPQELLLRNFWFCMLDDPTSLRHLRHRIGVDKILLEVDYPHADASWPDSQEKWRQQFEGIPEDEVRQMAWQNAAELFSHPVPATVAADPNAF